MAQQDLLLYEQSERFLRTQLQFLSEPYKINAVGPEVDQDTVDRVFNQVNKQLRRDYKHLYTEESIGHVSLQIQALENTPARRERQANSTKSLPKGIDIHTIVNKASDLPRIEEYEGQESCPADPQYERYKQLRQQLIEISEARKYALEKRDVYSSLGHVLRPLKKDDKTVRQVVQPNIYSARSEVADEIDRLRVLTARISAKLAANHPPSTDNNMPKEADDKEKDQDQGKGDQMESDDDDDKAQYRYDTTHDLFMNFDKT